MIVSAPASSGNLGPGFDCLGLALDLEMNVEPGASTLPAAGARHPAMMAFRKAGGEGELGWASKIPPGKGMGFSGASYVAGVAAAFAQRGRDIETHRHEIWLAATELEGHPDNAAPSTFGGLTVSTETKTIAIDVPSELVVVVWIPSGEVSTNASRTTLPTSISHSDAAYNIAQAAMLVAALATGDTEGLGRARDRLHEPHRLAALPHTAAAIDAALEAGAVTAFLSGSGPTAAAICTRESVESVAAALPTEQAEAHTKILEVGSPVRITA